MKCGLFPLKPFQRQGNPDLKKTVQIPLKMIQPYILVTNLKGTF